MLLAHSCASGGGCGPSGGLETGIKVCRWRGWVSSSCHYTVFYCCWKNYHRFVCAGEKGVFKDRQTGGMCGRKTAVPKDIESAPMFCEVCQKLKFWTFPGRRRILFFEDYRLSQSVETKVLKILCGFCSVVKTSPRFYMTEPAKQPVISIGCVYRNFFSPFGFTFFIPS